MRLRTGYSFRAAVGELEVCLARILECGWPVAPITDRASTFGWVKWDRMARAAGLRPVFGVELAVAQDIHAKKPIVDYWVFLAERSVESINRLVARATEQFRYQPMLSYSDAMEADGVIRMCGHRTILRALPSDRMGGGPFYGAGPASARGHTTVVENLRLECVATSNNFFPRREDQAFYEVVCGREAATQTYDQHIQTDEEWLRSVERSLPDVGLRNAALQLRNDLWNRCTAELQTATIIHPARPKSLREMCIDGAARTGCDLSDPVYAERLERELRLIAEKQFEDYFYLVAEVCQWARSRMAVGPARGSSCGSLVCYLLDITAVDPIPHGLIFERFIDVNRMDLPDIDIDFSDQHRNLVFEHLRQTYGPERVARLGAVAFYKPRSALAEAGAALSVPKWKCDAVLHALIERSSGDSRSNDALEDTLRGTPAGQDLIQEHPEILIAGRMEGHPRHYSQHAAGIVVASEPVVKFVAVDNRTGAAMCDKYDAESKLGLLKIDALGLTQLSVIEDALESVGMTMDELERTSLDDQAAFDVLNRGEFSGIFQWNGRSLRSLTQNIKVETFNDLVAISALARPGPLATGGASQWVRRRMGREQFTLSPNKIMAELTQETFGTVIYQETVMRITRELGNFSWAETAEIRKLMSRRMGNERFQLFEQKFLDGAQANGMPLEEAKQIWDQINTFGSWAFNKSHAVAYAYISYWCCWLKAHHPFEFAAATLTHENDPDKQIQLLRELAKEGFSYIPVDLHTSTLKWSVGHKDGRKILVGPLTNVHGIGPALANSIVGARARDEPLSARVMKIFSSPVTKLDSLTPIADAIAKILPNPAARNIFTPPTKIGEFEPSEEQYEALTICVVARIDVVDENENIRVQRRGYRVDGPQQFLRLHLIDDTGEMLAKINRHRFNKIGKEIVDRGGPNKSIWCFKGKIITVSGGFMVLSIRQARYIGSREST